MLRTVVVKYQISLVALVSVALLNSNNNKGKYLVTLYHKNKNH